MEYTLGRRKFINLSSITTGTMAAAYFSGEAGEAVGNAVNCSTNYQRDAVDKCRTEHVKKWSINTVLATASVGISFLASELSSPKVIHRRAAPLKALSLLKAGVPLWVGHNIYSRRFSNSSNAPTAPGGNEPIPLPSQSAIK